MRVHRGPLGHQETIGPIVLLFPRMRKHDAARFFDTQVIALCGNIACYRILHGFLSQPCLIAYHHDSDDAAGRPLRLPFPWHACAFALRDNACAFARNPFLQKIREKPEKSGENRKTSGKIRKKSGQIRKKMDKPGKIENRKNRKRVAIRREGAILSRQGLDRPKVSMGRAPTPPPARASAQPHREAAILSYMEERVVCSLKVITLYLRYSKTHVKIQTLIYCRVWINQLY